jgi:hypothetical protein
LPALCHFRLPFLAKDVAEKPRSNTVGSHFVAKKYHSERFLILTSIAQELVDQ